VFKQTGMNVFQVQPLTIGTMQFGLCIFSMPLSASAAITEQIVDDNPCGRNVVEGLHWISLRRNP
jgi:hypothetical protein